MRNLRPSTVFSSVCIAGSGGGNWYFDTILAPILAKPSWQLVKSPWRSSRSPNSSSNYSSQRLIRSAHVYLGIPLPMASQIPQKSFSIDGRFLRFRRVSIAKHPDLRPNRTRIAMSMDSRWRGSELARPRVVRGQSSRLARNEFRASPRLPRPTLQTTIRPHWLP